MSRGFVVSGAVARPVALGGDELRRWADHPEGVSVAALVEAASPVDDATHATVVSRDGRYRASIPLGDLVFGGRLVPVGDGHRLVLSGTVRRCWNVKDAARLEVTIGPVPDTVPVRAEG